MNVSLVILAAAISVEPIELPPATNVYSPSSVLAASLQAPPADFVIRGQNADRPYEEPLEVSPGLNSGNYTYQPAPAGGGLMDPLGLFHPAGPPPFVDPFLPPPGGGPVTTVPGTSGARPYRMGMVPSFEVGFLPSQNAGHGLGKMGITEFDFDFMYTTPADSSWMLTFDQQINLRLWDGAENRPGLPINLPGQVWRFGWDLKLTTPANRSGWSYELAFTPSINTDFERSLSHLAVNLDGRGMVYYKPSQYMMLVGGAGYWDRVNDRIVPYAGVVFTPNDLWEFRIMFPESRVSVFLGEFNGVSQWFYAKGEYHVEAYEIASTSRGIAQREQIELEDYRLLLGMRFEASHLAGFVEAGWVFSRNVEFLRNTAPDFGISSGFIGRVGLQF